jgi:hypothetical protein
MRGEAIVSVGFLWGSFSPPELARVSVLLAAEQPSGRGVDLSVAAIARLPVS